MTIYIDHIDQFCTHVFLAEVYDTARQPGGLPHHGCDVGGRHVVEIRVLRVGPAPRDAGTQLLVGEESHVIIGEDCVPSLSLIVGELGERQTFTVATNRHVVLEAWKDSNVYCS